MSLFDNAKGPPVMKRVWSSTSSFEGGEDDVFVTEEKSKRQAKPSKRRKIGKKRKSLLETHAEEMTHLQNPPSLNPPDVILDRTLPPTTTQIPQPFQQQQQQTPTTGVLGYLDKLLEEEEDTSKEEEVRVQPRPKQRLVRCPSDDLSDAFPTPMYPTILNDSIEISLVVGPELLNPKTNATRPIKDRESPKRYRFRLYENQPLKVVVEKFLEMDQSTWKIDELCLKSYSLEIPMNSTPKEESVADKDEIELCLRDIPTSELPQVADVAILQAPAVVPELERRITIQSNKFGQSDFKISVKKTIQMLRDAFGQHHHLSPEQIRRIIFKFEGEKLKLTQTVEELDLEDDDVIDAILK